MSETPTPMRPEDVKAGISEGWDAIAEEWDGWTPIVNDWFNPATQVLLEFLGLKPGDRILELAAGTGGLTLQLAKVVGSEGRIIATDIGPNMVKLAARNLRAAGFSNVNARVMDGENPDLTWASMDAIVCRQGMMFFADPTGALQKLYRVLRPGGRIGVTVFSTPDRNEFMTIPRKILTRWAKPGGETPAPPTPGPGPFSLAAPGALEGMLKGAGFIDLQARIVPAWLRMLTQTDFLRFCDDILGEIVAELPPEKQAKAWDEVERATASFTAPGSNGAPSELIVASGRRPSAPVRPR